MGKEMVNRMGMTPISGSLLHDEGGRRGWRSGCLRQSVEPAGRIDQGVVTGDADVVADVGRVAGRDQDDAVGVVHQGGFQHEGGQGAGLCQVGTGGLRPAAAQGGVRAQGGAELGAGQSATPALPGTAARIEVADLKERIRKLEAIAAGVEL